MTHHHHIGLASAMVRISLSRFLAGWGKEWLCYDQVLCVASYTGRDLRPEGVHSHIHLGGQLHSHIHTPCIHAMHITDFAARLKFMQCMIRILILWIDCVIKLLRSKTHGDSHTYFWKTLIHVQMASMMSGGQLVRYRYKSELCFKTKEMILAEDLAPGGAKVLSRYIQGASWCRGPKCRHMQHTCVAARWHPRWTVVVKYFLCSPIVCFSIRLPATFWAPGLIFCAWAWLLCPITVRIISYSVDDWCKLWRVNVGHPDATRNTIDHAMHWRISLCMI